jgi:hypothetical protein
MKRKGRLEELEATKVMRACRVGGDNALANHPSNWNSLGRSSSSSELFSS